MDNWWYINKPLTLNEIMDELEKDDTNIPDEIVILPPDNANDDITDEDSGDEDNVIINNLPGGQLRAETKLRYSDSIYDSDDEIPLSVLSKRRRKSTPQPSNNFTKWEKKDLTSTLPIWTDLSGCTQSILSPVDTFHIFFNDEVIGMIVHYSNLYAASHNRNADIEPDEIRCFIGILLLSGYAPLPRREMFWENSKDTGKELVSNAMSRNRFRFIMQNIHCNDSKKINPNDKFSKIRPLLDVINKLFIEMAPKEKNHSVDESMVPYYGLHGKKQFIRGKPIRWGYKLWTATTRLGYIERFEPYQGSTTILPQQYKDMGLGASVVLQCADVLVKNYPELTYHLYFDNFFTSLKLLEKLRQKGIKGTGTIRENRVGKNCIILDSKAIKKKERGFYDYATTHGNEVVVCKWNDNNVVTIASNGCQILPTHNVTRYSQKQKKS